MQYAIGIDLGGTKVAAGVVDGQGRILGRSHRPTEVDRGREAVLENTVQAVREALARAPRWVRGRIQAVGVGAPG
ncbi:MAG: ROK family protein, partial [Bacillota bacterium]